MKHKFLFSFVCLFFICTFVYAAQKNEQSEVSLRQSVMEQGYDVTVYFDVSSAELDVVSRDKLMRAAKLQAISEAKVYLTGYADKTGNSEKNLVLSRLRAESVKDFMLSLGIVEENIHMDFKGDSNPVEDGDTQETYAKNRRVEVVLTSAAGK
jgi:outer membrane protein OmpA-like peptidoglycan-associated protein